MIHPKIDKLLQEFEQCGILHKLLTFECQIDDVATFCFYLKDGSFHEINIINEGIVYFKQMRLTELLTTTPFYINHRFFTRMSEGEPFLCEDLFTFRYGDHFDYKLNNN